MTSAIKSDTDTECDVELNSVARQPVLGLTAEEARKHFLKPESYSKLELPPYIVFSEILDSVHKLLDGRCASDYWATPRSYDGINYTILNNKDGRYAWRPYQLINPALYVSLVQCITDDANWRFIVDRFTQIQSESNVVCLSIPVSSKSDRSDRAEQILQWWEEIEQRSLELSLDYAYLIDTDISDCYSAIYTHSIAWALHTKCEAKKTENRNNKNLIGNQIDWHIQDMRYGQTNGIPQGSVLMDFVAETVLAYCDWELTQRLQQLNRSDYCILRYRDDYRIFVNDPRLGEQIAKALTEAGFELGLKLNPSKTRPSSDIIKSAIKSDKVAWLCRKNRESTLQKHLIILHDHSLKYPNSGSLASALSQYHLRILRESNIARPIPIIGIVVDIALHNPRVYPTCSAILSKLLRHLPSDDERLRIAEKIISKFSHIPNTGHMHIWLQRITYPVDPKLDFPEPICKLVAGEQVDLWNNEFVSSAKLRNALNSEKIICRSALKNMQMVIPAKEVEVFNSWNY